MAKKGITKAAIIKELKALIDYENMVGGDYDNLYFGIRNILGKLK